MKKIFSAFGLLLLLLLATAAQADSLVTITKVVKEPPLNPNKEMPQSVTRLPKFFDEDARRGETYAIYWTAPSGGGLPPGVTVLFEYVLAAAPDVHALHIQYDFKTEGPRKVVFTIPEKDYREGGNVKAWRVRVVRAGKLLAEQTSPNWKKI